MLMYRRNALFVVIGIAALAAGASAVAPAGLAFDGTTQTAATTDKTTPLQIFKNPAGRSARRARGLQDRRFAFGGSRL